MGAETVPSVSGEDDARGVYDRLADDYDRIFADWPASVRRQGETLDRLIRAHPRERTGPVTVLDASCGIGTQAIGLALRGYAVHATDLSPAAVARAAREAGSFGAPLTVGVADLRTLPEQVDDVFDVVLSCDNALAHLLTDDDLRLAPRRLRAKLAPGGVLLLSIRDDDALLTRPTATLPSRLSGPDGARIVFQTWDWSDDAPLDTMHLFVLAQAQAQTQTQTEAAGPWETAHDATRLRAIRRAELDDLLPEIGLVDVRWHLPDESGCDQPILTAVRTP